MPRYHTGRVTEILSERRGLQRLGVLLDRDTEVSRALNYPELTGPVDVGDEVVCNTTGVDLGLGTGGWHVVHWCLSRRDFENVSPGHIMKLRYTSLQNDVLAASEDASPLHVAMQDGDLGGMPVVAAGLHSLVAGVSAGVRHASPPERPLRLAYVMTDGAALPLPLSDLVADLTTAGLLTTTVTAGHAFGGDLEAVTVASALLAARASGADVAVVAMGPGIVGTGSPWATTAREVVSILVETAALGGVPVACLRVSEADPRERHRGVSHHSLEVLRVTPCLDPSVEVVVPAGMHPAVSEILRDVTGSGAGHTVVEVDPGCALDILGAEGVHPTSMGRHIDQDPVFWLAGAAAGVHAGVRAVKSGK
ncbi:MAG: DUF3866 family protein [Actinobacteria bacterium ATB1]|nr:DUF3866 family protein [Actinobacteria bacterium ATB1]